MAMAPLRFIAGIAFGYFVVLPGAVGFLQNFTRQLLRCPRAGQ
jgi:Sec-independent protein secretion pathway component TatC